MERNQERKERNQRRERNQERRERSQRKERSELDVTLTLIILCQDHVGDTLFSMVKDSSSISTKEDELL